MSVRAFTVFQDIPSQPQPRDDTHARPATDTAATLLSTLAAIEKENLHPVTGQRAGPTMASEAKKRKTAALATKLLPVPAPKKHKEHKAEPKKTRKPLGSAAKPRGSDAAKTSKSSRSSRKASPLPPVAEERELHRQPPRLSTSQIDINSRCYELTVSPLADVSEAYDQTRSDSQEPDVRTERENSVEPALRDYFSPSLVDKPLPTTLDAPPTTDDSSRQTTGFSTPERKRIYSTFTFSSPSPTSERFKQAQVSPSGRDVLASNSQ